MSENNGRAGQLPSAPHLRLQDLSRLVGRWHVDSEHFQGTIEFEWMEGGFFLIQRIDATSGGRDIKGIEYIGFDDATQTLRSHFFDSHGSVFAYTWQIVNDELTIWFGDMNSDNYFTGHFADDGNSYTGAWHWPGGGYDATATRNNSK